MVRLVRIVDVILRPAPVLRDHFIEQPALRRVYEHVSLKARPSRQRLLPHLLMPARFRPYPDAPVEAVETLQHRLDRLPFALVQGELREGPLRVGLDGRGRQEWDPSRDGQRVVQRRRKGLPQQGETCGKEIFSFRVVPIRTKTSRSYRGAISETNDYVPRKVRLLVSTHKPGVERRFRDEPSRVTSFSTPKLPRSNHVYATVKILT